MHKCFDLPAFAFPRSLLNFNTLLFLVPSIGRMFAVDTSLLLIKNLFVLFLTEKHPHPSSLVGRLFCVWCLCLTREMPERSSRVVSIY
jgi:hypothetical protein